MNEPPSIVRETPGHTVHAARMTGLPARPIASWAIAMGLGGLFLGLVGATDSYEYALPLRLSIWLGLCAVGGLIAITIERALAGFGLRSKRAVIWWAALTLALAVAMVPVIFLVNSTGSASPIASLPMFAFNSLAISAALVGFRLLIGALLADRAGPDRSADEVLSTATQRPRLLDRLEPALQTARLIALKSEGHYLKVLTDRGSQLILMRLKDAIAETSPVEGMQVHRSWWIARQDGIERRSAEGRLELKLDDENWVPVSRSYKADWLAQNW